METVNILMSTYNGEKYVAEQIVSIMDQEGCETVLTIRDDGSEDNTVNIIKNMQLKYGSRIKLYCEKNIGYRKSFLKLLSLTERTEFYAFADQDDIWKTQKLRQAIHKLKKKKERIALYASSVTLTDDHLHIIGRNDIADSPNVIESYFVRHRMPGCTMVFTPELKNLAEKFVNKFILNSQMDHDFIIASLAYAYGSVIRDHNSYILHRRHHKSVTGGGLGFFRRMKVEKYLIFQRKNIHYEMAGCLMRFNSEKIRKEAKPFIEQLTGYKQSRLTVIYMINNPNLTCGIMVCDIEAKLKIWMKNF